MASVLGETLGRSHGVRHAIKGRMRRGRVQTTKAGALYAITVFLIGFILHSASRSAPGSDDCRYRRSTLHTHGELVRLPLVRGSARCKAIGPGSVIDGLGRLTGAGVG
jgi:hypothetical protein